VDVSIQAVSPLLGLAFELAGAAAGDGAAGVAGEGVGAEPEAAAVTFEAAAVWATAAPVKIAGADRTAINAKVAKRLIRPDRPIIHSPKTPTRPGEAYGARLTGSPIAPAASCIRASSFAALPYNFCVCNKQIARILIKSAQPGTPMVHFVTNP
jgi:hypothetical protein